MSETRKKVEILMRAASGIALGAALGSSLGLVVGSAVGSLILPGVGTLIGASGGAILSSVLNRNRARKARNSDEKLLLIIDSITQNDKILREDILTILDAKIQCLQEDKIKELLIKMRFSVNLTDLKRPQKTEIAGYIITTIKELERSDIQTARYFLEKITSSAHNFPNILDISRELENNLSAD